MGILQIHDFVADVVCRLHQIHQRMTGVAQRLTLDGQSPDAHLCGQPLIGFLLALEESELALLACCRRGMGIFHDAGNRRVRHHETSRTTSLKLMRQQSEGIGITLKMRDVVPEGWRHLLA